MSWRTRGVWALFVSSLSGALALGAPARGQESEPIAAASVDEAPEPARPAPPRSVRESLARSFAGLRRHELPNGVHVVLDPFGEAPLVTVAIGVSVGSRDEPPGWTGLAHLAEHLMFRGTSDDPNHFTVRLEQLGAIESNALTGRDATTYFETVPTAALDEVLWMEAERFAGVPARLDAGAIASEREIVLRERDIREARRRIGPTLLDRELYPAGHPYARTRDEEEADLRAIDLSTMQSFLQRAYVPSHLTVVVSGRFDPQRALERITEYFGVLRAAAPATEAPRVSVTNLAEERRLLIDVPRATDQLSVLWPTPAYGTVDDAALDIAARLLADAVRRRLATRGLTVVAAQASEDVMSTFFVLVELPRRFGTRIPLDAVDAALEELGAALPSEDAVERGRVAMLEQLMSRAGQRGERARMLSRRPLRFPDEAYDPIVDLARYDTVDPPAVLRVIRSWLPRRRRVLVSLNASSRAPERGRLVTRVVMQ